jgi:hypothetical protein
MATVRDVISGAYSRLSLLPVGTTLDPDRAAEGLTVFIDMVNELALDGIFPGGPIAPNAQYADTLPNNFIPHGPDNTTSPLPDAPISYALSDPFPFPSLFINGFKSMLAEDIADNAGVEAGKGTLKKSAKCKSAMLAYYISAPMADFDKAITRMPSLRRGRDGGGNLINGSTSTFPTNAAVTETPTTVDITFT